MPATATHPNDPPNFHNEPDERRPLLADSLSKPHPFPLPSSSSTSSSSKPTEETVIASTPSTKRLILTLSSIYVGVFLGAIDSTIIATLSAPISTSFESLNLLSWLATAYLIANAACQPLSGRLTDIFSRRTGLVFSNVLFAAGNLICGLANNEWVMIVGRVVAGMGGGGLMAIATFVGSDLVPLRQRGLLQGLGNVCYGLGAGLGGLFGGWVNDVWGWRVAFLAQVPPVIISGILVYVTVNVPPKKSEKSKLSRVDFLGSFTLVVTLVLLLLGLNSGGNIVPWSHPLVLVSLSLSLAALAAFVYVEVKIASEPVIPIYLLLDRTVLFACLTNWFNTMTTFMTFFYVPIYFQVKGSSTTEAGISLIPEALGGSAGSLGVGFIMNYTGKYKLTGITSCLIGALGVGLLCTLGLDSPSWPTLIYMALVGIGCGGMLVVMLLAAISAASHSHQAVVTSATYAFRSTGSTIGVTIASSVYQNILRSSLLAKFSSYPNAEAEIKRITSSFDELKHLPVGWKEGVMNSFMDALRGVFGTALGIALLAVITAACVRQNVLHKTLERADGDSGAVTGLDRDGE